MRRILALLLLLGASPVEGAISLVSEKLGQSTTGNNVTTVAIDTTTATTLELSIADNAGATAAAFTDQTTGCASPCNTWVQVGSTLTGPVASRLRRYRCSSGCTVGTGHQIVVTSTLGYPAVSFSAWSDTHASGSVDQTNGATSGGPNTVIGPGSITPTVSDSVILTTVFLLDAGTTATVDLGYTILHQAANSGNAFGIATAYLTQGSAAATAPAWTLSANSLDLNADIANMKPVAAAAGGSPRLTLLGVGKR